MPPPSYEEDQAAATAQRGYVYAYPQYYPGQVSFLQSPRVPFVTFASVFWALITMLLPLAYDARHATPSPQLHARSLHAAYALPS
jgi:hypothetical protein